MTSQVQQNRAAFAREHAHLEHERAGAHALMHDGQLIKVFDEPGDAFQRGMADYGRDRFSIIQIGAKPIKLGAAGMVAA